MIRIASLFTAFFLYISQLAAQDTLPRFNASTRDGKKILIGWANNYKVVTQISIQRSADSLRNFRTILTVPDPTAIQNGFVDAKAPSGNQFYRLFIVLDSGKYEFSPSKRPKWDTSRIVAASDKAPLPPNKRVIISDTMNVREAESLRNKLNNLRNDSASAPVVPKPVPEKFFIVKRKDSIVMELSEKRFKNFRDSMVTKTKDTMVFKSADTILIKPFVPKEVFKPSIYIFTEKDGNVTLALPDAASKHYSVKFFDDKMNPVFDISRVKESPLTLDKVNFLRSGWYRFELYEDGKLKEKNKFFIPKDF